MWTFVSTLILLLDLTVSKNHRVDVHLRSHWADTSLLAETSEFLADESLEVFWKFLDQLEPLVRFESLTDSTSLPNTNWSEIDSNMFKRLEPLVFALLDSENTGRTNNQGLFHLFLSARVFSPTVEMKHQVALTTACQILNCTHSEAETRLRQHISGSTWAHVGDRIIDDVSELAEILQSNNALVSTAPHLLREKVYPAGTSDDRVVPTVILYGDIGKKDFYTWHKQLKSFARNGTCNYVFRHYMKDRRPSSKPALSGYGVELALKSTEYKAMDDTKLEDSATSDHDTEDVVVQGFNFTQLNVLYPDLKSELKSFQKHLLITDNEIRPLKAWQFRELGLQASQVIVDASVNGFVGPDGPVNSIVHPGLLALQDISQNLPVRASRLVSTTVRSSLRDEVSMNHYRLTSNGLSPGQTVLSINGLLLSPNVDIFALLDLLRHESRILMGLHNLGIPNDKISNLLVAADSSKQSAPQSGDSSLPGMRYSLSRHFALDLAKSPISYMNNLESDPAYANWPNSLFALFTDPSGGVRRVRRNLYNVILVMDPMSELGQNWTQSVELLLRRKTPVRFGLLWSVDLTTQSASLVLARIFNYLCTTITQSNESPLTSSLQGLGSPGAVTGLSFLTELYTEARQTGRELTVEFIQSRFEKLFPNAYIEDIISAAPGESDYDDTLKSHQAFLERSGLSKLKQMPLMLFNGIVFDSSGISRLGGFEDAVDHLCLEEMVRVQQAVYQGQLFESSSISDLYTKSGSLVSRFSPRILDFRPSKYIEFGRDQWITPPDNVQPSSSSEFLSSFADRMRYFQKGETDSSLRPLTIWVVVGDLDAILNEPVTPTRKTDLLHHFHLARAAITYLRSAQSSKGLRIGFVFNPSNEQLTTASLSDNLWLTRALYLAGKPTHTLATKQSVPVAAKLVEPMAARNFANRLFTESVDVLNSGRVNFSLSDVAVTGVDADSLKAAIEQVDRMKLIREHSTFCRHILGLQPAERAIVINGKIIGPLNHSEEFTVDDFRLVEKIALKSGAEKLGATLLDMVGEQTGGSDAISELTWRAASLLHRSEPVSVNSVTDVDNIEGIISKTRFQLDGLLLDHSGVDIPAPSNVPAYDVVAVVNPCSREAQRLSHILTVLQQSLSCRIRVVLNPLTSLSEIPVKNFYRFVWEPSPWFIHGSSEPHALFTHLPGQPVLTLGMDTPHGWMVAAVKAVHDLDNLRLADVHTTVEAVFELEHLLLEGHCFEGESMKPPRGLQLTLGPSVDVVRYDTIVMANLGYFQLKSGPGAWILSIRPGRSRDLYTISNNDDQIEVVQNSAAMVVTLDNFRSKIITVYVDKRPERMNENLLNDAGIATYKSTEDTWGWLYKNSALWSTISDYAETICPSWLTSLRRSLQNHLPWQKCTTRHETINVFSLASGHLYERLLRIMMLTVIRHTKSPVKFWFLKNYLSPTFKDFIPHMAAEYGFEYELVQYQWPRWLHAQTEKQRIIWGYKILFLDVLFPLNVTKIIFVDADQIVRADLQELVDLDLGGAPYGYTPFCNSRREMDGFRFWKQGYWASHLAGRPYHISALYVVDLVRFRQLAAGDRLRGQYHGLSQDPNSLSNLDQDLPNNMIHQVPIKSLPQEWLWCETWCSDESKARAKTIDLCNNPQTKEPKLTAAMRIAPEWVSYDREIKKLWQRTYPPVQSQAKPTMPSSSDQVPTDKSPSTSPPVKEEL